MLKGVKTEANQIRRQMQTFLNNAFTHSVRSNIKHAYQRFKNAHPDKNAVNAISNSDTMDSNTRLLRTVVEYGFIDIPEEQKALARTWRNIQTHRLNVAKRTPRKFRSTRKHNRK